MKKLLLTLVTTVNNLLIRICNPNYISRGFAIRTTTISILLLLFTTTFAQVAINTTGENPDASAILDLSSNSMGLLIPRMTTNNRTTNTTPVEGLLVYDTDTESFWYYDGAQSVWTEIKAGSALDINSLADGSSDGTSVFLGDSCGYADIGSNNNVALGIKALKSNIAGKSNVAIGNASLAYSYHNSDLVAIGDSALYNNGHIGNWSVSAIRNTAIGSKSLFSNTEGSYNTANGYMSLYSSTNGDYNVAVGNNSLYSNTNGDYNVAVGNNSLYSNTVGDYNTAIGMNSLEHHKTGDYNTANGYEALYSDTIGENNTAMGYSSLYHNLNGGNNTALGRSSLYENTSGDKNTAIGVSSMGNNTSADYNTAIGYKSLYRDTTGEYNSATGAYALYNDLSGKLNTSNGYGSLYNNTTANSNVAMGSYSLYSNTDRSYLVAIGDSALYNNGINATGSLEATCNTAIGSKALMTNTTGYRNTALGYHALYDVYDGYNNTAVGSYALVNDSSGYKNTAIGNAALANNKTGINNTASGNDALYNNSSGEGNVAMGVSAMYYNSSGSNNVAIGTSSLTWNNTSNNVGVGYATLYNHNSGTQNTAVGSMAGYGWWGDYDVSGCVFLGYEAGRNNTVSNRLFIDNSSTSTPLIGGDFSANRVDINGTIKITGGTPGSGKVLTSDVDGLATWETPTIYATSLNDLSDAITDGSSIFVGDQVGTNDDGTNYNTVMGDEAFKTNTSGVNNTAFGYKTLELSNGSSNSAFGQNALRKNSTGSQNTAIGEGTIFSNQTGSNNTAVGFQAGFGSTGDNISGCVFLGNEAGKNNTSDNKLFIDNSDDTTPLIGGDFSTDELYFNTSKVGIGTDSPNEILEVTGTPGNTARMIVSDGNGSSRKVILFVSPSATYNYARIDAYDYGTTSGKTLRINTVGDGDVIFGGNLIPEADKSKNLGSSTKVWDNVYGDDFLNMGAAAFANINVTKQLISFPPQEKKSGAFDEFTDKGLKELDPASLPKELTEDNALLIDEMTTYNYKANYEQQMQIETLKKENYELKIHLEKLEKLIDGLK